MWIKDPANNNEPSITATAFVTGFLVVLFKLIFSGVSVMNYFKLAEFTGSDFSMSVAALGALYVAHVGVNKYNNSNNQGGSSSAS